MIYNGIFFPLQLFFFKKKLRVVKGQTVSHKKTLKTSERFQQRIFRHLLPPILKPGGCRGVVLGAAGGQGHHVDVPAVQRASVCRGLRRRLHPPLELRGQGAACHGRRAGSECRPCRVTQSDGEPSLVVGQVSELLFVAFLNVDTDRSVLFFSSRY